MNINKDLKEYIEKNIFPEYSKNEQAHNIDHIKYVISRSFKFADTIPNINYDMLYLTMILVIILILKHMK